MGFKLTSPYIPKGDQENAIKMLTAGIKGGKRFQTLLGATGTGKTFTMANVIQKTGKKTLVMCHNKTLAAQLYSEFKQLFPDNRVEYFVSMFDFYQPEAYKPSTNTFIDKTATSNEEIEMLRLSAFNALTTRDDVIVIASVAAIYGSQNPQDYKKLYWNINVGDEYPRIQLLKKLVDSGYQRNNIDLSPGKFRAKGDVLEICPGWTNEFHIRISLWGDEVEDIALIDTLNGTVKQKFKGYTIFPAQDYITSKDRLKLSIKRIEAELIEREKFFTDNEKVLEKERLTLRTNHDLEALREFGICPGIENYSRHLELREEGEPPYTLMDYFGKDWLLVVDESHMSLPQVRGMYNTDKSRKTTLVEHGFRLPSAMDNRPLSFDEYLKGIPQAVFVSATPGDFELEQTNGEIIEQIIRPTGLVDPIIHTKPKEGQIDDIIEQIHKRVEKNERVFITTLTIRMSEELTKYLKQKGIKVAYLHNELKTFERTKVLNDLRRGKYDVVVGINLLREGLDIPEVSLVCILDADKEGFLRNARSLIQTIGRAARNVNGEVIMYCNSITRSMKIAIDETNRRRQIQQDHNIKNNITPMTIIKEIHNGIVDDDETTAVVDSVIKKKMDKRSRTKTINDLRRKMIEAASEQKYEKAAQLRDLIIELQSQK